MSEECVCVRLVSGMRSRMSESVESERMRRHMFAHAEPIIAHDVRIESIGGECGCVTRRLAAAPRHCRAETIAAES